MNKQSIKQSSWLTDSGSLTEKLEHAAGKPIEVAVLAQGMAPLRRYEQTVLETPPRQWAWRREVNLMVDQQIWVTARTVMPLQTFHKAGGRFALLNNRPLGPLLFKQLAAERGPMEVSLTQQVPWRHQAIEHPVYTRHSVFYWQQCCILVQECFLPGSPLYVD